MEENFIQLKERDTLKVYLKDTNGKYKEDEKGNRIYLEFDLEDIRLLEKYNKCEFLIRKAQQDFKFDLLAIEKRQDAKGKMLLSKNDEDKVKALQRYYKTTEEAMDLFLGKGGVQKIFGDTRYYEMYKDLNDMLEPIIPKLEINKNAIFEKVKNTYKPQEKDVLKDE